MGGWVDYFRRVLGWKSAAPAPIVNPRVIYLEWTLPTHTLEWSLDTDWQTLTWTTPTYSLTWTEDPSL